MGEVDPVDVGSCDACSLNGPNSYRESKNLNKHTPVLVLSRSLLSQRFYPLVILSLSGFTWKLHTG